MIKLIKKLCVISFVTLFASATLAQSSDISKEEIMAIKFEIIDLVHAYALYRDNDNAVGYASVFAEDGKLIVRGNAVEGRKAIQARLENATTKSIGMHMMGTSHIEIVDADNATGVHYAEVYSYTPKEDEEPGVYLVDGPRFFGKYIDVYARTDEGWKITERKFTPVFTTTQ